MSNIDAQIKELQHKKKKIDYIKYIEDIIKNDTKCVDFKDVKNDIVAQIIPLLKGIAESIETGITPKDKANLEFTPEQHSALTEISNRYLQAKANPKPVQPEAPAPVKNPSYTQEPVEPEKEMNPNDKMNFAMNNRHLANQRVQVLNDEKADIKGLVVGLDAPYIIVKTDTGHTIKVPLNKVNKI